MLLVRMTIELDEINTVEKEIGYKVIDDFNEDKTIYRSDNDGVVHFNSKYNPEKISETDLEKFIIQGIPLIMLLKDGAVTSLTY